MIDNQRGRRNLTINQKLELGMKRASLLEKKAKENQIVRKGNQNGDDTTFQKSENLTPINTTKEIADYAGVSIDTIK